jgi:hypothetical protein
MNEEGYGVRLKQDVIAKTETRQTEKISLRSRKICDRSHNAMGKNQQDQVLYQLLKLILSQPESPENQRRAINELLTLIPNLNGVKKHRDPRINYKEALNLALENVWQKIHTFPKLLDLDLDNSDVTDVNTRFVKWFNKILKRRIFDLYRQLGKQPLSLDQYPTQSLGNNLSIDIGYLEQLANQEWLDELRDYLQHDPEGILQEYPKGYPQCTCQELIKRRLLREKAQKWQEIASELNLPQGTVTAFWYRKCLLILNKIATKQG